MKLANHHYSTPNQKVVASIMIMTHGSLLSGHLRRRRLPFLFFSTLSFLPDSPSLLLISSHSGSPSPSSSSGGGGGNEEDNKDGGSRYQNQTEALLVLDEFERGLESLPTDLATAIESGRIPGEVVRRFLRFEKSMVLRWLLKFEGFKDRLLADDLFLTKVAIECGVGLFTKSAAEIEKRTSNFFNELDFVCADVIMALVADFMLVWISALTISLKPPIALNAGRIAKFFNSCPDNAFQVALPGTSYSFLQRTTAILINGGKLFCVGTCASLIGTCITNALIYARKSFDNDYLDVIQDVPIIATSVSYGIYMAVSSNIRYQIIAGVIEQRILAPLLHNHELALSALCFAVRTGNTFLGSLMWVDYARWVGVQ